MAGRIQRPVISRRLNGHRYALLEDVALSRSAAIALAAQVRKLGFSVRVSGLKYGWFVYHYPQYPRPRGYE